MGFTVSSLSQWNDEKSDKAEWILKPLLGGYGMKHLTNKKFGLKGQNILLPELESTAPAQSGYSCGFTSSGTTTITQTTLTSVPFTVNESICLKDLEQYFTLNTLPGSSNPDTFDMLDTWVDRKLQKISQNFGKALWQGKTTYANDTWLKLQNGFLNDIDAASDEVIVTGGGAGTAITTSNVRTIFEEALFSSSTGLFAIPQILESNPIAFCGQDTFATLQLKLMQDNLFHISAGNQDSANGKMGMYEMIYPGSQIKVVGIPELNSTNSVETGGLPTEVKNRIVCTYQDNLIVGMNAENDISDFKVWYSEDDDLVKFRLRGHFGTAIQHTDLVVTY